jgi:peptidoglycan-associated lipoprotein
MHRTIAAAAVLAAFAGCASTPPASTSASSSKGPVTAPSSSTARAPAAETRPNPSASSAAGAATGASNVTAPSQRSVYFDYDSNVVKDDSVVKTNAQYLSSKRISQVRVEGNTDERGSREYNLALGQRRADAVKQRLTLLGVPAQQIETVSFGEEKPRADSRDERAFAENRRADIVYGR